MHGVSRRTVLASTAFAASVGGVRASAWSPAEGQGRALSEALRMADGWLSAQCAYDAVPDMAVAVVAGGRLAWAKGYGAFPADADASAVFPIGSVSKLFTAVAAMTLVEEGKLSLDAPITRWLPWAAPASAPGGPITLRSLLSHSSGLPRDAGPCWTAPDFAFPDRDALKAAVRAVRPTDPPLTRFAYSNVGLALVGEMIEAAAGRPYAEVVQARVLAPLSLRDTRPSTPPDLLGRRIPPGWSARKRDGTRDRMPLADVKAYAPAAAFTSTVRDLATFTTWSFDLLRTGAGPVLKAATLREMQRRQFVDGGGDARVGLGYFLPEQGGVTLVGHDGETPGYRANVWMHPQTQTAVIVLRSTSDGQGPYAFGVLGLIKARLEAASPPPPPTVDLEPYAGRYGEYPWWGEGIVAPWNGRLAYLSTPTASPGGEVALFQPTAPDVFRRVRGDGSLAEEAVFQRDPSGRVTGFVQHANLHRRIA